MARIGLQSQTMLFLTRAMTINSNPSLHPYGMDHVTVFALYSTAVTCGRPLLVASNGARNDPEAK